VRTSATDHHDRLPLETVDRTSGEKSLHDRGHRASRAALLAIRADDVLRMIRSSIRTFIPFPIPTPILVSIPVSIPLFIPTSIHMPIRITIHRPGPDCQSLQPGSINLSFTTIMVCVL